MYIVCTLYVHYMLYNYLKFYKLDKNIYCTLFIQFRYLLDNCQHSISLQNISMIIIMVSFFSWNICSPSIKLLLPIVGNLNQLTSKCMNSSFKIIFFSTSTVYAKVNYVYRYIQNVRYIEIDIYTCSNTFVDLDIAFQFCYHI